MSRFRAVWADEGWPVFTLSVFLLVFFLFPPHPHRTLPSTQTLISQISEKVGPFHFLSIYNSPIDGMLLSVGTSGSASSSGSPQSGPPARRALCSVVWAGRRAGPGAGGQVPLPRMFLLLGSLTPHVSACPLSWAPLLGRSGGRGAWHETGPAFVPGPGQLSAPGGAPECLGAGRAGVLRAHLRGRPEHPAHVGPSSAETPGQMKGKG